MILFLFVDPFISVLDKLVYFDELRWILGNFLIVLSLKIRYLLPKELQSDIALDGLLNKESLKMVLLLLFNQRLILYFNSVFVFPKMLKLLCNITRR